MYFMLVVLGFRASKDKGNPYKSLCCPSLCQSLFNSGTREGFELKFKLYAQVVGPLKFTLLS